MYFNGAFLWYSHGVTMVLAFDLPQCVLGPAFREGCSNQQQPSVLKGGALKNSSTSALHIRLMHVLQPHTTADTLSLKVTE
jgi:hypothetical protein